MKQDPRTKIDIAQDHTYSKPVTKQTPRTLEAKPKLQWVREAVDARDYKYVLSSTRTLSTVDLRKYCTSVENQGNLGSCTGQAIASAIELLNKRNNKVTDISRLFIYYFERMLLGTINYDSGAYIRDGIKSVNKYGAPLERLWPYLINKFRQKPNSNALNDALRRKVTRYERVADHAGCIDALNNGYPVVIGFDVYPSFLKINKTGMMVYPDKKKERCIGGHAVLLVGYDSTAQHYIVRNSWGTSWGDNGYFYMPFRVIQDSTMSADFWIIKSVDNP